MDKKKRIILVTLFSLIVLFVTVFFNKRFDFFGNENIVKEYPVITTFQTGYFQMEYKLHFKDTIRLMKSVVQLQGAMPNVKIDSVINVTDKIQEKIKNIKAPKETDYEMILKLSKEFDNILKEKLDASYTLTIIE